MEFDRRIQLCDRQQTSYRTFPSLHKVSHALLHLIPPSAISTDVLTFAFSRRKKMEWYRL